MKRRTKVTTAISLPALAAIGVLLWVALRPSLPDNPPGPVTPVVAPDGDGDGFSDVPVGAFGGAIIGNWGYDPNPAESEKFLRSMERPSIRDQAPGLFEARGPPEAAQDAVLLYRALYDLIPGWRPGAQGIGDCVSWGWAHGVLVGSAVEHKLGHVSTFKVPATEPIYGGSRVEARGKTTGSWSDGSYGAAAAKWVRDWGVLYRETYPGESEWDLRGYSKDRAKQWGYWGNGGQRDKGRLDATAKQHPVKAVALVTTFDEAAAAIRNGYPVPVCSGQGFSSTRDKDGFCPPSGSWSHCMCFIGVRWDREGLLCLNSWGPNWVRGPKWPDDQPDGSFWVDRRTAERMLSGRDSFAVSGDANWPARRLKNSEGW